MTHDDRNHHELSFKKDEGRREFVEEVNQLLARAGTMSELSRDLRIERAGTPIVRKVRADSRSDSGDPDLDRVVVGDLPASLLPRS